VSRKKKRQQQHGHAQTPVSTSKPFPSNAESTSSLQNEAPPSDSGKRKPEKTTEETSPMRWYTKPDWWMVILTGGLAIFAAWSAYIFEGQLREMHTAMLVDQRAWVGMIHHADIEFREGAKGKFGVILRNNGQTPALGLDTLMFVELVPQGSPPQFTYGSGKPPTSRGASVVQPGMEVVLQDPTDFPMTTEQIQAMKDGTKVMYIYGKLTYRDIFKAVHHGTFCIYVEADLTTTKSCDRYNEYD